MKRRRRTFRHWAPLGALFFAWLWERWRPWEGMFQPSRAARLLSEHDHRMLLTNRGQW